MLGHIILGKSRAFPVDFDKSETVGHLKDIIKGKKMNALAGIDANNLTL